MRKILLALFSLSLCLYSWASSVGGYQLSSYVIVYDSNAEPEEGSDMAERLQKAISERTGTKLPVCPDDGTVKGHTIAIIHTPSLDAFEYSVSVSKGKVLLDGGGCWAMGKAADLLADALSKGKVSSGFRLGGTVRGEFLFPRPEGVNLRILDDNIWDYSSSSLPEVWEKAGEDCRDDYRAPFFAQLIKAYMPDVITLQEYNRHMHERLSPLISDWGYVISSEGDPDAWNNTPVFYNKDKLELLESHYQLFLPLIWSNGKSKSFTSAVFRQKDTGKVFGVVSTHLWWKSESAQPGSMMARASQVRLIMAEIEILKAKYDCPFFVAGDMNGEESTPAIQQFLSEGYVPCYKAATVYGNRDNGHHECFPYIVGIRASHRISPERSAGAIDHCFIYNGKGTEIKVFDCIQAAFTVKLTDHYPNLIDAVL